MEKPRIIIADTDLNYIIPLQAKFAEEMYEQIELVEYGLMITEKYVLWYDDEVTRIT